MRKLVLLFAVLLFQAAPAYSQIAGSGTINSMKYTTLTSPGGCTAAVPCQIVTYLHYFGGENQMTGDLKTFFGPRFWAANPHVIVLAPQIHSANTNNWGGVQPGMSPNMKNVIALVRQIEATIPTQTNNVVLTGGSMGALGTEEGMILAGPKGTMDPGVFAVGLSYAGADYKAADQAAAYQALCGVNITLVHGTADHSVPYAPDAALAKKLDGCPGFKFVSMQGALHGVWGSGPQGYEKGPLLNEALATARTIAPPTAPAMSIADTMSLPTTVPITAPLDLPAAAAPAVQPASTLQSATIKPGGGSVVDAQGHRWEITANGKITEDGRFVYGGGGTAEMAFINGVVYGRDDGHGPINPGGWFTISSTNPSDKQRWIVSSTPPGVALASGPDAGTAPDEVSPLPPALNGGSSVCTASAPNGNVSTIGSGSSSFTTQNGQIYGPDGKPFIARGSNIRSTEQSSVDAMLAAFPGINFVRVQVRNYDSPASLQAMISKLTSRGIVVELEDHPNAGGGQGSIAALQGPDVAWLGRVAAAFKDNPYVWFGTYNEPPTNGSLSAWHKASYDAIRGASNNSIIMIEPGGSRPWQLTKPLDLAVYKNMTDIVADPHIYPYQDEYSTSVSVNATNVRDMVVAAQKIVSASGPVPVIIAEFGDSTIGLRRDQGGMQSVQAVLDSGVGFAAETWIGAGANRLQTNGQLTDFGQATAKAIASGGTGTSTQPAGCDTNAPVLVAGDSTVTAPALPSAATSVTASTMAPAATRVTAPALIPSGLSISQVAAMAAGR